MTPASGLDSSASENSVLFRFISAQFAALQTKIDSKFASLERSVDSKLEQLEVKLERHITQYSYSQGTKLHNMENHLAEQINVVRKDHFHADKPFRQLVDGIREVLFFAGQHLGKLTDTLTAHNFHLEKAVDYFHLSKENHRNIAQYYKQMIESLDKLEAYMHYVVRTLKDHYPIPQPEDQHIYHECRHSKL